MNGSENSISSSNHSVPALLQGMDESFMRIAESFYSLTEKLSIIGWSSTAPREGTSTLLATLALLAAQRFSEDPNPSVWTSFQPRSRTEEPPPSRIVLIDTQFRHPVLHRLLRVPLEPGLLDALHRPQTLSAFMHRVPGSTLRLVPAGISNGQPVWQMQYSKITTLLQGLKPQCRYIFLDLPPLLHYSEGLALGKLCDGMVLIVKSRSTKWEMLQESITQLNQAKIPLIGTIFNFRQHYLPSWIYRRL